jgi:phthalate 4,5-dioxygenase
MLTTEQNDLVTRTRRGTLGGALLRSYWQPAALSEELPPGGAPVPVTLLGEELALFRDDEGYAGLLGLHCSHRGADLSYGRCEDGGLRCLYHGWLYDRHGRCLEQPGEPASSNFKDKIEHLAYPCIELGGLILAYLGEGDPPPVPSYEFLQAPEPNRWSTKLMNDCNYLQGNEGNIDPQHLSFLHRQIREQPGSARNVPGSNLTSNTLFGRDVAPKLEIEETDYGVRIYSVRRVDDDTNYLRVSNFILPNMSSFPGVNEADGYQVHWHVPIDDTHHWKYILNFKRSGPIDKAWMDKNVLASIESPYHLRRKTENRYLQDRDEMKEVTFTGIGYNDFQSQDAYATETQGAIQDRTVERLGTTDVAIAAARRKLLAAVKDVEDGRRPPSNDTTDIVVKSEALPATTGWKNFWRTGPA